MKVENLVKLWNCTQLHRGTSGARVCSGILLGLYNGTRFPFDLTELRCLDASLFAAALDVITSDARHCHAEVHELLNQWAGRRDFGMRFEHLAWDWNLPAFKRGRCKKDNLYDVSPPLLAFELTGSTATGVHP